MTDDHTTVEQDEAVESQAEDLEDQAEELSEEEQALAKLKEAIRIEREEIGALRVKLTVTIPEEIIVERRSEQFLELKREAFIPGFRKGHAPLELVEKRFGADVGEDIKGRLVGNAYVAATEREDLRVLGDPLFWGESTEERVGANQQTEKTKVEKLLPLDRALESMKLPSSGDMTFSCELELKPEFELPTLEKIPVEKPSIEIEDDDVEEELRRMRSVRGTYKPVTEGAVEADDLLYGHMRMTVDGNLIESEENFELSARDTLCMGVRLVGFGDMVVGKKVGETATIEGDVPDDHENIDIRGKKASFEFTISEIKRFDIPPVDEAFMAAMGADNEEELREEFRSALQADLDHTLRRGMRTQIADYLVEKTDLVIPEGVSQRQTDRSVARRMIEMYQSGLPEAEIKKSVDEMRSKAHEQAVRDLKLYFILEKIAEERDIDVPEEQINAAIAQIARRTNKRFDRVRDELSKGDGLMTLYLQLRDQRVLDMLLDDAAVTEIEGPKKKAKTAKKKSTKRKAASAEKNSTTKSAKTTKSTKAKTTKAKTAKKKTTKKKT